MEKEKIILFNFSPLDFLKSKGEKIISFIFPPSYLREYIVVLCQQKTKILPFIQSKLEFPLIVIQGHFCLYNI